MKPLFLALLPLLLLAGLTACSPLATPLPPEPTSTPLPPTHTPTSTIVWFPPTPTNTPFPTPTGIITPTLDVRPQYGDLLFSDEFEDRSLWILGRGSAGSIAISNNELTVAVSEPRGYLYSLRKQPALSDFYAEITASPSICRGADEYGLLLRFSKAQDFYRFSLTCDGQVRLDRFLAGRASSPQPLIFSGAVPPGAPSMSRLAVLAQGKEMRFFVNGEYQFTVRDSSLPNGGLGVFARASGDDAVTVNFSDLSVYNLPN